MAPASHPIHSNTVACLPRLATAARGCDSPPVPRQQSSTSIDGSAFVLGEHILVPLSGGLNALIDIADFEHVDGYCWRVGTSVRNSRWPYAKRRFKVRGKERILAMHRVIAGATPTQVVDHANRDTLDNRRSNLRICSRADNGRNVIRKRSRSGFRGVQPKKNGRWCAFIRVGGKNQIYVGSAGSAEEAAALYDAAAIKHHGEFAVLNFPEAVQ